MKNWRARALLVLAGCVLLVILMFVKEASAVSYTLLDGEPPVEPVEEPDCD
jgi:hypothetical protein